MRNLLILFFAKLLGVNKKTVDFVISESKEINFLLIILIPNVIISSIIFQLSPLIVKYIVDLLVDENIKKSWLFLANENTLSIIIYFCLFGLILQVFDIIIQYFSNLYSYKLSQKSHTQMEDNYFKMLANFDLPFLDGGGNSRLLLDIGNDIISVQERMRTFIRNIISLPATLFSLLFVIPLLHPYFFVLVFFISILNLLLDGLKASSYRNWEFIVSRPRSERSMFRWHLFNSFPKFYFGGLLKNVLQRYSNVRTKVLEIELKKDGQNILFIAFNGIITTLANYLVLFLGAFWVLSGTISIGSFALLNSYLDRITRIFTSVSELFDQIISLNLSLTKLEFILKMKPKLIDLDNKKTINNKFNIQFKNVSFNYPNFFDDEKEYFEEISKRILKTKTSSKNKDLFYNIKEILSKLFNNKVGKNRFEKELIKIIDSLEDNNETKVILDNINLDLFAGKSYALVGKNGAGKTTLVNLLKRGSDPTKGEVLIDGDNLRLIDRDFYKTKIVSIEQNTISYKGILSIKDLLLLNTSEDKRQVNLEKINVLLKKFELEYIIKDLDKIIGEGIELSGGQKQILELIRILISERNLVILDEATNQLDAEKELLFINLLKEYLPSSIIIFVTHRMSTCLKCDEVICLKNGIIEAKSKPKELLKEENEFSKFWHIQNN
jgi:ABC-type multidrug transport system fused ATPase/permease subunit